MRYLRMIGLAAIMVMVVMVLNGVGSASATVLCTSNANCTSSHSNPEEGKMWDGGDEIRATASTVTLTSSLADVTCAHSEANTILTSTGGSGAAVKGELRTLSFTGCTSHSFFTGTKPCNDIHLEPGWSGEVNLTTTPNGTLTISNPSVHVECPSVLDCTFGATDLKLPLAGGNPAIITANEVELNREGGGFCPEDSFWDATYKTSSTGKTVGVFVHKG